MAKGHGLGWSGAWFHFEVVMMMMMHLFSRKIVSWKQKKVTSEFMFTPADMCPTAYIIRVTIRPPASDAPRFDIYGTFIPPQQKN